MGELESTKEHFNRVAQDADAGTYENRRWMQHARTKQQYADTKRFIEQYALPRVARAQTILELGPGPGTWTSILYTANPRARFILTDIAAEMLRKATSALPTEALVETREGEFLSAPIADEEADCFFSSRAVEYIGNPKATAEKIYRALRKHGTGCVITKTPKTIEHKLRGYTPSKLHQNQIQPKVFVQALRDAGFINVRAHAVTCSVPLLKSATADKLACALFRTMPFNPITQFFTESYGVTFVKA
ncbi:MAG: Methyltransferase domain [Candidatus Parcubacteria bacterium]|jgi:ubiquinone/menaquinone biosynthesis C-methylase UbiE